MVATTLEALAQGDRMVGVVTHVTELAERVPVRFRVARERQDLHRRPRGTVRGGDGPDVADGPVMTSGTG